MSESTGTGRTPRDPRLDFFRGLAMLIIYIAHVPGNAWTSYIPARFGWSDAAEMFVFCSGFAAAIAFGGTFRTAGFGYGTARIVHRMWQIYVGHIGMFFFLAALLAGANALLETRDYIGQLNLTFFFENPAPAMLGLFTLTWVPNYFDILPMYIGALAMVPAVMALALLGRPWLALAACAALYTANAAFGWGLPAELPRPGAAREWFFNPLAWQLLFFTGFGFAMGWIPAPPRSRALTWAAAIFVVVCIPAAHWPTAAQVDLLRELRVVIWPAVGKTDFGILRYLHFLALAYLALRLVEGRHHLLLSKWAMPIVTVGRNSLPSFLLSIGLARVGGIALDLIGESALDHALVNLAGLAILIGFAYWCTMLKRQPWRAAAERARGGGGGGDAGAARPAAAPESTRAPRAAE